MAYTGNGGQYGHHGLDIWSYIARCGVQMRGAGDDFFAEGDGICSMRTCQYLTQVDIEELLHKDLEEFSCQVPGCKATFKQLHENEAHYNAKHRHTCKECRRNLPSAHLLDLHIIETHDTYFQLLSTRKASYECFVESCKDKFWSSKDRRQHCVQIHSFPSDFKFEPKTSRKDKANSASPEVVKKRSLNKKSKSKPRPASVYVGKTSTIHMETDQVKNGSFLPPVVQASVESTLPTSTSPGQPKSKLPVLNRRLSLNAKDVNNHHESMAPPVINSSPVSTAAAAPVATSVIREPLSLAKMGQRLTAKSTFDVTDNVELTPPSLRRLSGIPTRRSGGTGNTSTVKKMNSTSSTATSMSSPDRSLTASPTKSRSTVSMNNNAVQLMMSRDDFNGNSSTSSSPQKSRIPVLRSPSYKVPRNVCFGHSSQKAFDLKHWYQTIARSSAATASSNKAALEDSNFERDMKMALD